MERFIFNLLGKTRTETLEGREYLVCPAASLAEGVWNGSNGPLYYPRAELQKSVPVWNTKPIVMYHPEMNGKGISACTAEVLESRRVGMILNTKYDTKLRHEAWFDKAKTEKVYPELLTALNAGQQIEVSTGLFTDQEPVPAGSKYAGKEYVAVTRNYRPDHLAILPGKVGAYSIADGGGLLANEAVFIDDPLEYSTQPGLTNEQVKAFWENLQKKSIEQFSNEKVSGKIITTNADGTTSEEIVTNVISHQDVARGLTEAMLKEEGKALGYWPGQVQDVYDDFFIYSKDGKYFKKGYSIDANYNANPFGKAEEVTKFKEYRASDGTAVAPYGRDMSGSKTMHLGGAADHVNDHGSPKKSDSYATGGGTPEPKKVVPGHGKHELPGSKKPIGDQGGGTPGRAFSFNTKGEPTVADAKPQTVDEYVSNAPPEVRAMLNGGLKSYREEKTRLVATITTNTRNTFTKEALEAKDNEELRSIAALIAPPEAPATPTPVYLGANGAPPVPTTNGSTGTPQSPLPIPTLNFKKEKPAPPKQEPAAAAAK